MYEIVSAMRNEPLYSQLAYIAVATVGDLLEKVPGGKSVAAVTGASMEVFKPGLRNKFTPRQLALEAKISDAVERAVGKLSCSAEDRENGIHHAGEVVASAKLTNHDMGRLGLDPRRCADEALALARRQDPGWRGGEAFYEVVEVAVRTTYEVICASLKEDSAELGVMQSGFTHLEEVIGADQLQRQEEVSARMRREASEIRHLQRAWNDEFRRVATTVVGTSDWTRLSEPESVPRLQGCGADTTDLEQQLDIAAGHLLLGDLLFSRRQGWAASINEERGPLVEVIGVIVNGALDVVKDGLMLDSDYDWIPDDFFSRLDTVPVQDGASIPEIIRLQKNPDQCITEAMHCYLASDVPREVAGRFAVLSRYKTQLELSLWIQFNAFFTNRSAQEPPAQRFKDAYRNMTSLIIDRLTNIVDVISLELP